MSGCPRWAPPLPSLRRLTASLRDLNEAWEHPEAGPEFAMLVLYDAENPRAARWRVSPDHHDWPHFGREYVPADVARFDAVGAARRLLAAARDAGAR